MTEIEPSAALRAELVSDGASARVVELVLAAHAGAERLAAVIDGSAEPGDGAPPAATPPETPPPETARPPAPAPAEAEAAAPPADENGAVFLKKISVRGFRGVGPTATLALLPAPGLTVALGRNGSGKSSFAEAAELALTGGTDRARRGTVWADGWRSLHHTAEPARISVDLVVEGVGPLTVVREWPADAGLHDATTTVHAPDRPAGTIEDLGWQQKLEVWRPFLAYSELSGLITDRSSSIFDKISRLLGHDDLTAAEQRLAAQRGALVKAFRAVRDERAALVALLTASDDPRAARALAALGTATWRSWRPDDAEAAARSAEPGHPGPTAAVGAGAGQEDAAGPFDLGHLMLAAGAAEEVAARAARLRAAARRVDELAGTPADDAHRLVDLLRFGLAHLDRHGDGPCPLCGAGTVDADWRARATGEVARLSGLAAQAEETRAAVTAAVAAAHALVVEPPRTLRAVAGAPADEGRLAADVLAAWERWAPLRAEWDPAALADGLERRHATLTGALSTLRAAVLARAAEQGAAWNPIADRVLDWARAARTGCARQPVVKELDDAILPLHAVIDRLRDEKLGPFRAQHAAIWSKLRQESNVDLGPLRLEGRSTSRRVQVDVTVDGAQTQALGVMSQGELHALGLTLFLPQATAPDSPFRFLVIDDPVQAMDPSKVDGLARVLLETAKTRQVVVFTHDDRLGEAVRRLATVDDAPRLVDVVRWENSVVTVRDVHDPARRCLEDAGALAATPGLPDGVKRALVPGYCKSALDAVCNDIHRRRRLAHGASHREVDRELLAAGTAARRVALVVCNDAERPTSAVRAILTHRWGPAAGDAFATLARAGHQRYTGDCRQLIKDTRDLVRKLRTL